VVGFLFIAIFSTYWQANKSTMNQFGEQIRQLREKKSLLQRQVANQLDMDTPMLSKIERGERNAKREQVTILSKIFNVPEDDLLSLWLADKLFDVVKDEDVALKALSVTEDEVKKINKKTKKNTKS
jgi:transcriptional regulator with XRE-family HTH domain